jgi:hypothetical protein
MGLSAPMGKWEWEAIEEQSEEENVAAPGYGGVSRTIKEWQARINDRIQSLMTQLTWSETTRRDQEDSIHLLQNALKVEMAKQNSNTAPSSKTQPDAAGREPSPATNPDHRIDHFPYSFWPALPWTQEPPTITNILPPSLWLSRHPEPDQQFRETRGAYNKRH